MDYNEGYAKSLIEKGKWIWAKTYPSIPHEYIIRNKCGLSDDEFLYLVVAQRTYGVHEQWHKYNFPYLYLDGYKYWTMGDAIEETIILNRQKVFSEFDNLDCHMACPEDLMKTVSVLYNSLFPGRSIYEAGCGNGNTIKYFGIPYNKYRGVDPSSKAIESLKEAFPEYGKWVFNMSFEESVNYWTKGDAVVLATFGAASYFMHQYLNILSQSEKDYFLMFYKEGYCPQQYAQMHHFNYTDEFLQSIFPHGFMRLIDNYRVITSKQFPQENLLPTINN